MSFEAKRFRHVAVPIPVFAIAGLVIASPRYKSPEPQQPDVSYHQALIGRRGQESLDRGLGFGKVTLGPAVQQCLHQNTRRLNAMPEQPSLAEQMVDGGG